MFSVVLDLLRQLAKYLAAREVNYRLRTLRILYDDLQTARNSVLALVGGRDTPRQSDLLLATRRVRDLEKLLTDVRGPDEVHDPSGNTSVDGKRAGDAAGGPPGPLH